MGRRARFGVAAAAVALVAFVAIWAAASTDRHTKTGPSEGGSVVLPTSPTVLPTTDLPGFRAMLASVRGKPVLVNVWASWCGPCIKEAPALASLAAEFAGRVQFVGLDVLDTTSNARDFIARYAWTFPSVADPKGEVRNGLGFVGQPVTVLFDANGKQVFGLSGPITEAQLREALAKVS
jgi:cytochrome c biogenesis protein CcmG/thiol:disulfide interchange protein DsbE